jgi:Excalibur calcium-binding domain
MGNPRGPWPDHGDDGARGRRDPVPDYPRRAVPPYPGRAGDRTIAAGGRGEAGLRWADEHDLPPVPVTVLHGRWGDGHDDLVPIPESESPIWPGDVFWRRDEPEPGPVRRAVGGARGWYRSSPLWLKVTTGVAGALAVLGLVLGVSPALRQDGSSQRATAVGSTTTSPSTTVPPSTTTTGPPPTTAPAMPPPSVVRTTTTAPTTTVPPTTAPTTAPPTTPTTEPPPEYRTCWQALRAGALPLEWGEPGYGPHLDDDGDGRACEWGEGQGGPR